MLQLWRLIGDGHQALVPRLEALDGHEAARHDTGVCEQLQPLDRLSHGAAVLVEHVAEDRDVHVKGWPAVLLCNLLDECCELGLRSLGRDEPARDGGHM